MSLRIKLQIFFLLNRLFGSLKKNKKSENNDKCCHNCPTNSTNLKMIKNTFKIIKKEKQKILTFVKLEP